MRQMIADAQAQPIPPYFDTDSLLGVDGIHVLVAEDDIADAYLIQYALSFDSRVAKVWHAADGQEALEAIRLRKIDPDLAIIDLRMPRMDGFHLLLELACRRGQVFPTLVLTSSTAPTDFARSRLRGADMVLTKPDTVEQLKTVLHDAIGTLLAPTPQ